MDMEIDLKFVWLLWATSKLSVVVVQVLENGDMLSKRKDNVETGLLDYLEREK